MLPSSRTAVVYFALVVLGAACSRTKPEPTEQPPRSLEPRAESSTTALVSDAAASAPPAPAPPPADAGAAPSRPASLTAKAVSPFAVRLSWDAGGPGAAGFEVQIKVGEAFVRAALVNPTKREMVHHLRLPGQVVTYRVRAFNADGASEPSPAATLTMPERMDTPVKMAAMGPCVPKPSKPPKSSGCDPDISTLDGGNGHVVYNVPGPGNGCMRHLVGEVAGCPRELGVFMVQADIVVVKGHADEGWPLLHAIAGAGQYTGAQIQTLRFSRGRYAIVDEARVCGESDPDAAREPKAGVVSEELERCSPPFEDCQRDPTPL